MTVFNENEGVGSYDVDSMDMFHLNGGFGPMRLGKANGIYYALPPYLPDGFVNVNRGLVPFN